MQVVNKIDHLITELNKLKPTLSDNSPSNEKRFKDLLTASLESNSTVAGAEIEVEFSKIAKLENGIPSWVNRDYGYDPQNPRKPNMRELMEAMSGKNVEDLYKGPEKNWQRISRQASEMLYGVIGANEDTRDWLSIMSSKDIIKEARKQTGAMYEPALDIQSNFNDDGILTKQIAVIKDSKGNILRPLSNNINSSEEALLNFGATKDSIPADLEKRINPEKFDDDLLTLLKSFEKSHSSIQLEVLESASEVIANKISQEIPLDELSRL